LKKNYRSFEIRADYEMAVKEIEKNKSVIVQWPSTEIGIPKVQKQKQATKKISMQGITPNHFVVKNLKCFLD
jgi:hypothetical protein